MSAKIFNLQAALVKYYERIWHGIHHLTACGGQKNSAVTVTRYLTCIIEIIYIARILASISIFKHISISWQLEGA